MDRLEALSDRDLGRGDRFGQYSLLERIGRGGEATIWSAWDEQRQRVLALKIIPKEEDEGQKETQPLSRAFEHQIHLIASLNHPNILPLYDFGETSQFYYFAMYYSSAGSLARRLVASKLDLRQALNVAAQITNALHYLHKHKIIHRDLKPSNILLDGLGRLYVGDFGLSKQLSLETVPLHTGRGTGPYAPYEQFAHLEISPQSDIFSFGVLMYEVICGYLPWEGAENLAVQQAQYFKELPEVNCGLPELNLPLTEVLRQWTAYQSHSRPETVQDAFEMLRITIGETLGQTYPMGLPTTDHLILDEDWRLNQDAACLLAAYHIPVASSQPGPEAEQASEDSPPPVGPGRNLLQAPVPEPSDPETYTFQASLTHLALIDSALRPDHPYALELNDALRVWMLHGALVYDYNLDQWQRLAQDPALRQKARLKVLLYENEAAAARSLRQIISEPDGAGPVEAGSALVERLVDWAIYGDTWAIREDALSLLERSLAPAKERPSEWIPIAISSGRDRGLAALALEDTPLALRAAHIIGALHSRLAVETIMQSEDETQTRAALAAVEESAGSLPPGLPAHLHLAIRLRRFWSQVQEERHGLAPIHALLGLLMGLLAAGIMALGLFYPLHATLQDILYRPAPVSNIITLVEINDASLEQFGRWDSWPRSLHARLIEQLHQAGAQAIVLDYLFGEPAAGDEALAQAMRQAGTVVQPILGEGDAFLDIPGTAHYLGQAQPTARLLSSGSATGYTNVLHDPDGLVRRMPLIIRSADQTAPSIVLAALEVYLRADGQAAPLATPQPQAGSMNFAGRRIPTGAYGDMWIRFAGPPAQADNHTYHTTSFQDVLRGATPREWLKNKIVLVGLTATAEPDRYLTPISQGRPMYGLEILANAIETIWSGRFITPAGSGLKLLILLVLGLLGGLSGARPGRGLVGVAGLSLGYFLAAAWIFDASGLLLDLLYPFLSIWLGYGASAGYRYSMVDRRYRGVAEALESRVTQNTARTTLEALSHGQLSLAQSLQEVTILAVELHNLSEAVAQIDPSQAAHLIEQLQDIFGQAVIKYEGTILNGAGEQLTAVFNIPLPQADHPSRAAQAALRLQQSIAENQALLDRGPTGRPVRASAGIYTGRATVGYTRFGRRRQLMVLGAPLSIAAQLAQWAQPGQTLLAGEAYISLEQHLLLKPYAPYFIQKQKTSIMAYALIEVEAASEAAA